jgi:hypothetical protein
MLMNVTDLGGHEVEVVEEPFGRRRDELACPDVVGQRPVRVAQYAGIVVEPGKDVPRAAPRARIDGEARRERERALLQPLDTEQFVAKRFLRWRCLGVPELPEASAQMRSPKMALMRTEGGTSAAGLRKAKNSSIARGARRSL